MGVDKRCVAREKRCKLNLQPSEIQRVKILYICRKLCKSKQMHARKTVCGDAFATPYIFLNY